MNRKTDDDAWMFEPIDKDRRTTARVTFEREFGTKREADDSNITPTKKSKQGREKTWQEMLTKKERKQAFQEWMQGDSDDAWVHSHSCLIYRFKDGKMAWAAGTYNDSERLVAARAVTINSKWNNLCYSARGSNPAEEAGEQDSLLDLHAHGHIGLFVCRKSKKWACHFCKQYGYITNSK